MESAQLDERLVEKLHLIVEVSMPEQKPVRQEPPCQTTEETFQCKCLKTMRTYPKERDEQCQLWKNQAAHSDEQEGIEQGTLRFRVLISLKQEE